MGLQGQFLTLTGDVAFVDSANYSIPRLERIYAILTRMALGE